MKLVTDPDSWPDLWVWIRWGEETGMGTEDEENKDEQFKEHYV